MNRPRSRIAACALLAVAGFALSAGLRPTHGLEVAFASGGERRVTGGFLPFDSTLEPAGHGTAGSAAGLTVRYRGQLRLDHRGVYHVALGADPGSSARLAIDDETVVAFGPDADVASQGFRELEAGLHGVELVYRHLGTDEPRLGVAWSKGVPGSRPVPQDAQYAPDATPGRFAVASVLRFGGWLALAAGLWWLPGWLAPGRARAIQLRVAALAVGTLLASVLAEVALRVAGFEPRTYVPGTIWLTYDYPKPGTTTRYVGYLPYLVQEFEIPVSINARGWRDRDFPYAKPPGTVRVVVVGDSYVEGKEVLLEETLHKRLEQRLNAERSHADRRFEVIALARGGIGTEMEYRVIQERALRYAPDLVVLAFFAGNDVRENHPTLDARYQGWLERVYMSHVAPARVSCTDALTRLPGSVLNDLLTGVVCDLYVAHLDRFTPQLAATDLVSPDALVYRPERYDAAWTQAWRRSEEWIVRSRDAVEAAGADFLLVLVHSAQVAGASGGALATGEDALDLGAPFRRLHALCEEQSIDCLDTRPLLEEFASATGEPFAWRYDAHWNAAGHRVVADALFERIAPRLAADSAR